MSENEFAKQLLAAEVARVGGRVEALAEVGRMLERLTYEPPDVLFDCMAVWVAESVRVAPLPAGEQARADYDPRLNVRWDLAANPGARVGLQVFAALTNGDEGMAQALWQVAVEDTSTVRNVALMAVLQIAGRVICEHQGEPETGRDKDL
ncbi:hypothetical protein [Nocardiopsis synnemataformans]|uniref:hypothetical protein n=1 Tax=Nocardiopsis synnemataformans TaxID=61305 RepID=UPI003EC0F345